MTILNKFIAKLKNIYHWICGFIKNPEPYYRAGVGNIVRYLYQPEYIGFDKLPKDGGYLLICNHVSYMDGMVIAAGCNRKVRFVIDGYIYDAPIVNYFMKQNGAIPILPNRKSVTKALEEISLGLENGDVICIFPEGQITYTGGLSRFRPGVEYIVQKTPVDVYPMAITGLWGSIFSRKYLGKWYRFFPLNHNQKVKVICGDAIKPDNISRNMLQTKVLHLKYKIQAE